VSIVTVSKGHPENLRVIEVSQRGLGVWDKCRVSRIRVLGLYQSSSSALIYCSLLWSGPSAAPKGPCVEGAIRGGGTFRRQGLVGGSEVISEPLGGILGPWTLFSLFLPGTQEVGSFAPPGALCHHVLLGHRPKAMRGPNDHRLTSL
jgi:hypothetical protein